YSCTRAVATCGATRPRETCKSQRRTPMLLRELADRIRDVTYDKLPAAAVAMAKEGVLDTIGVTLAGAHDDTTAVVARTLRPTAAAGPALVFGTADRLDLLSATLINGVASHALDFDDCNNTIGGHPS